MSVANTVLIVSQVNFRLGVKNISQLDSVFSPEFMIHDTPWKVRLFKTTEESESFLAINLCVDGRDKTPEWCQSAYASFKLMPFNGNLSSTEYQLEPYVFDCIETTSGCSSIRWTDLFDLDKYYVKDDTIDLELKIDVADPSDGNKSNLRFESVDNCCDGGRVGTFRAIINNIEHLMAVRTPEFKLRNLPWFLTIFKDSSRLGLRLNPRNTSNEIVYNVKAQVKIISSSTRLQTLQKMQAKELRRKEGLVMEQLIAWDDLIKPQNGFIKNGSIILEIEISAEKPQDTILNGRKRQPANAKVIIKTPRMECSICEQDILTQDVSSVPCGHMFCTACITNKIRERRVCPTCNGRVQLRQIKPLQLPL